MEERGRGEGREREGAERGERREAERNGLWRRNRDGETTSLHLMLLYMYSSLQGGTHEVMADLSLVGLSHSLVALHLLLQL